MTLRLVSILSAAVLLLWPAQLDAFITPNTGCHHNGTWFADKSVVPSMEKCLNCQCNRKTLVCRLKVCPEMPMPPPRGCVVVQKKSTCCPYLSCARLDAFYKIPTKRRIIAYLDHYERESIDRVVNDNMLQRRSDDSDTDLFVCVKNGTVYKSGSAMSSSNLCSYCYCIKKDYINDFFELLPYSLPGGTEKCVKPKCMLPVEGCKPIFVDSTCCPVRYDCSSKTSGKSSQEMRYRKTSNKHFQRMSQRLQRNRGCTVGSQFYAEGQKMRSDSDRPCDICFCIRGTRRCAPKKCSPALKNCIPVVPKGQCCPSSYDCGSQRNYRRSHNSRQFNLYNMLFGKEDDEQPELQESAIIPENAMAERYPHDRHPTKTPQGDPLKASSEKSILDTIREGLEFIDGNNNKMLANNLDLVGIKTTVAPPLMRTEASDEVSSTSTVSFLDLLLGPTPENGQPEDISQPQSTTTKNTLSWMDILLGPDEEELGPITETYQEGLGSSTTTLNPKEELVSSTNNIKRIADDFEEQLDNGGMAVGELPADAQQIHVGNAGIWPKPAGEGVDQPSKEEPSLFNAFLDGLSGILEKPLNGTSNSTTTTTTEHAPPMFRPLPQSEKPIHTRINSKLANLTVTPPMLLVTRKYGQPVTNRTPSNSISLSSTTTTTTTKRPLSTTTTRTTPKPQTTDKSRVKSTKRPIPAPPQAIILKSTTPAPATSRPGTPKPSTKTLPKNSTARPTTPKPTSGKPHTTKPPVRAETISPKVSTTTTTTTTPKPSTTTNTIRTTSKPKFKPKPKPFITSTHKPLVIQTNPTILEAEPLEINGEPTLPPSLPNLKIIPFLPTDAVETVPKDNYPANFFQQKIASDKMDVVGYDSVEDSVALYSQSQPDQAAYKYKFNVEVPAAETAPEPVVHVGGQYEGTADYVKFDFDRPVAPPSHSGFLPPTETEGGFMPKEPLVIDGEVLQEHVTSSGIKGPLDNFHITKHIIDITTAAARANDTASSIEITTPDPFKDVIHTEPPPKLDDLMEDKAKKKPVIERIETVTYSVSNSTSSSSLATSFSSTAAAVKPAIEKEIPLVDKYEINKLDMLLDELLGMQLSKEDTTRSTVPPFKQLPSEIIKTNTTTTTTTTTEAPTKTTTKTRHTPTAATTGRPTATARVPAKKTSNKTKNKQTTGNRRKVQSATRRTNPATGAAPATGPTAAPTRAAPAASSVQTTTPTTTTMTSTTEAPTTPKSTLHPFLNSPFDKLPFMDASYEVKPHRLQPQQQFEPLQQQHEQAQQQFHHYQHATRQPTATAAATLATPPQDTPTNWSERGGGEGGEDPLGQLKLAGCNIYGRMYRVGRIIVELSSQCLECKCTEVGVKCGPLDC
ncbi:hypothetical protein KR074_005224 [Drosophila pseudoananassae]|nr:hypothetical protein KR074_005224 [Drosophila pseudoananassae]